MEAIAKGEINRHVGYTNMNAESSRSHSILRLLIESKKVFTPDVEEEGGGGGGGGALLREMTSKCSPDDEKSIAKFYRAR